MLAPQWSWELPLWCKNNREANTVNTYFISSKCVGCGGCHSRCPADCIDAAKKPLEIKQDGCIGCGACYLACPIRAIVKR